MRTVKLIRVASVLAGMIAGCRIVTACYETIVMDPKAELPVVVNCVLVDTTSTQSLTLHYACSPSQSEPTPVEDARVSISDDNSKHVFEYTSDGKWISENFSIEYNKEYTLEVRAGDEMITAKTKFPDHIIVHNATYGIKDREEVFQDGTNEILDECGGIMLQTAEGKPYKKACKLWIRSRSPRNASESVTYTPGHEYTCEFLATDNKYVDNFNVSTLLFKNLECYYANYRDLKDKLREIINRTFDTDDAEKLDYALSLASHTELLFKRKFLQYPLHRKVLRIDYPENYSNKVNADYEMRRVETAFLVVADFNYDDPQSWAIRPPMKKRWQNNSYNLTQHEFMILSDEYDTFLKEVYTRKLNDEDGNAMDILYNRENLPTNVSNGYGIFGAMSVAEYDPLAEFYYDRDSHPERYTDE